MKVAAVRDISEQVHGVTYAKSEASVTPRSGYSPILRANNIGEHGLLLDDLIFVPNTKISSRQRIMPNDIVVAASSGSISVVGKSAQVRKGFPGGFGAFCRVLRPGPDVDPYYFGHYFKTAAYRRLVSRLASGVSINNLKKEHLDNLQIPLPPLAEQTLIARILDTADALRANRRKALHQLDALLQSTFIDMFGDPVINPRGWDTCALGEVGDVVTGNTPSRKRPEYYGNDIEWIKSDNINHPSFFLTEAEERLSVAGKAVARTSPKGSILVTCIAGSPSCIGNAAIADREVAFNQQINAFVPGQRIAFWFAFGVFWVGKRLIQRASTNSMKGMVSKSAFSGVSIPVPPLSLQNRFAAIADSVECQKANQRTHLSELDTLFASLQSRAFRGDL